MAAGRGLPAPAGLAFLQAWLSETAFTADLFVAAVDAFRLGLTQPTVLVLDKAASHRAVLVRQHQAGWAARGLRLVFLPPYAPELNRIEILWRFCQHYWLPPAAYRSAQTLRDQVASLQPVAQNRYTTLPYYFWLTT